MKSRIPSFILLLPLIVFVAACSSTAPRETPSKSIPPAGSATQGGSDKKTVRKWGGGYYQDDGPGENPPVDLAAIPDAEPKEEALHRFANRPYVVLGKEYVPYTSLRPYKMRGTASWYGKKFHGQKTSIGEVYDMYAMTAAHPILPIPSYVRVSNPANGKSVVVRVNDRGPFHAGRVIDLSWTAAAKLEIVGSGSGTVEVEAILPGEISPVPVNVASSASPANTVAAPPVHPTVSAGQSAAERDEMAELIQRLEKETSTVQIASRQSSASAPPGSLFLQLGAFSSSSNAQSLRERISRDLDWLAEPIRINQNAGIYRVQLGPYATRDEAEQQAARIDNALGYRPTLVLQQ